jgi:hypothetical protein
MVCQVASSGAQQRVPITLQLAVHREGRAGARDSRLLPEVHPMDSELQCVQAPTARYRSSRDIPGRRESVIPWCVKRHRAAPGSGCPSHCGSLSIGATVAVSRKSTRVQACRPRSNEEARHPPQCSPRSKASDHRRRREGRAPVALQDLEGGRLGGGRLLVGIREGVLAYQILTRFAS